MSAFRRRWSELLKEGWSSKRPRGLETEYTYCSPDKTRGDVRGVDYFVGSEELMRYLDVLDKADLERHEAEKTTEQPSNSQTRDGSDGTPSVSPAGRSSPAVQSSIATPQAPASNGNLTQEQRNLNAAFAEVASDDETETRLCPTSPHTPNSDSGSDSAFASAEESAEDFESVDSNTSTDINVTKAGSLLPDYATLESEGENDDGFSSEQDVEFGACDGDEEYPDDDDSDLPDIHFDDALLAAVGGAAGLTVENLSKKQNAAILANMAHEEALAAATSPVNAPFYFMTPRLWENIATASEDYFAEKMDARVTDQYNKQVQRERRKPGFQRHTREAIQAKMEQSPPITGRDVCVFIGLLIARAIAPNKEKLQHRWKATDEGAIPRGCFGRFMTRDRFAHIARNLQYSSNRDPRAVVDLYMKVKPHKYGTKLFTLCCSHTAYCIRKQKMALSSEAMLPSRSSFNRMRVYMKVKPHKYGTKLFTLLLSCLILIRVPAILYATTLLTLQQLPSFMFTKPRVYVGDEERRRKQRDLKRRMTMGYYSVGTVMTGRKGLAAQVVPEKNKKKKEQSRPTENSQGTYT
ncbi:Hypothetical protein PHPALM_1745, partial [Phytophthora palmivora]